MACKHTAIIFFCILATASCKTRLPQPGASTLSDDEVGENRSLALNTDPHGDLQPLPSVQPILQMILDYLRSPEVTSAASQSRALEILRGRLNTSLFHLNFKPEIVEADRPEYTYIDNKYPYDPVYDEPFPKRPSLEALDEALEFISRVKLIIPSGETSKHQVLDNTIRSYQPFEQFSRELVQRQAALPSEADRSSSSQVSQRDLIEKPVDSYLSLQKRLEISGEVAAFPEFSTSVEESLQILGTDADIQKFMDVDPVFRAEVNSAVAALEVVRRERGNATSVHPSFSFPYPYRRTIQAVEKAVAVFDMKERFKYEESEDWYEVEDSWYPEESGYKGKPKLLPLYHYNRYKYQQFGLLSNPLVVLLPWQGDASEEDLIRLRSAPLGLVGVSSKTLRVDRHHNSPLDFWYHDINHIRRMWGYDKRRMQVEKLDTWNKLIADMRERQRFLNDLLAKSDPDAVTGQGPDADKLRQIRHLERYIIFETVHETALAGTRDSVLNDLLRITPVRQPFERQIQTERPIEFSRTFDGNVFSGADKLPVDLSRPTIIRYYFDRAPSFIANVHNKVNWGFHGSTYEERKDPNKIKFRTAANLAQAASNIFDHVNFGDDENNISRPSLATMEREAESQKGQPELYNYYALNKNEDKSDYGKTLVEKPPAQELIRHETNTARSITESNPGLMPSQVAGRTMISNDVKELVKWMADDLELYLADFDAVFRAKLQRIERYEAEKRRDLAARLAPLQNRLSQIAPNDLNSRRLILDEIQTVKKEHTPHGFVARFSDANDYISKFVGVGPGKLLRMTPTESDIQKMNASGSGKLYVDTWNVPFFNTATQSEAEARNGVNQALRAFREVDLNSDVSLHQFMELVALFARPEFDDIRRYKLKVFPSGEALARFGGERSDAGAIGERFPAESFIVTNKELSMDELSYSFGRRIHYMGLISHLNANIFADGRHFTGPADFLEHDQSHGFFSLHPSVPGAPEKWEETHEEFLFRQAQEPDVKKRVMNSLVYFHFTHESAYKSLLPGKDGSAPDPEAYRREIDTIAERIETKNDYDWVKKPEFFANEYKTQLEESFSWVSEFFKARLESVRSDICPQADRIVP